MIGRLKGVLEAKSPPHLLVDVNGVGYDIQAPMSTIYQLPELGNPVTLLTYFYVREDAQILFGFSQEEERALFKALIKVSGVGPKMALVILSGMNVSQFQQCIDNRHVEHLVRLPGVGKKTAERLVVEMSGKLGFSVNSDDNLLASHAPRLVEEEAVSALIALGYKPQEASRLVHQVMFEGANSQELIRRALQSLSSVKA